MYFCDTFYLQIQIHKCIDNLLIRCLLTRSVLIGSLREIITFISKLR